MESAIQRSDVARAISGDQAAFAALVRGCQGTLYSTAIALLHNEQDALDAVQEALLQGWRKLHTLREERYFNTWLTRILIHTCINQQRKRKKTVLLYDAAAPEAAREEVLDVRRAMDTLDEKTRLCAVLFYYEDMTLEEIARTLELSVGTVKSRLHRAREKLRQAIGGEAYV